MDAGDGSQGLTHTPPQHIARVQKGGGGYNVERLAVDHNG